MKHNSLGKPTREWDTESFEGTADVIGDAIGWATVYGPQTGVYIKNTDSSGTLYIGVGLDASELSSTFPGIDLGPGDWAEIPCSSQQDIAYKASSGTISFCAQRFSE